MDASDITELFEPVAHVAIRRMFGGHGIYDSGCIVAIESDGIIWMKADAMTLPAFEQHGLKPFTYSKNGKTFSMSYRALPDSAYDDPDELRMWFRLAEEAARRAAQAKAKGKRSR